MDKIDELEKSLNYISAEFDNQRKEIMELNKAKMDMKKNVGELQAKLCASEKEMSILSEGYEALLNNEKKMNVEIKGIAMKAAEDVKQYVMKIGVKAATGIKESDIVKVGRIKNKSKEGSSIIVTFSKEQQRNDFIQACRKVRIYSGEIGAEGNAVVYVNEDISWLTRKTFAAALNYKKR